MGQILSVDNLNVYYGAIHAIKGISFEVNEGEIVTLIGANGAGKSTTLQTVSGLLRSRTGSIEFDVDDDTLQVGDVLSASLPQLGYTAMVRVADIITQSEDSGTTRTIRLGTPTWHKT